MPNLVDQYQWTLLLDGNDVTALIDGKAELTVSEADGGRTQAMAFAIQDLDQTLALNGWEEVKFYADMSQPGEMLLFGGYVMNATPRRLGENGRIYEVQCRGYVERVGRVAVAPKTYVNSDLADIVADVWDSAGLTDFDCATYVDTGATIKSFTVTEDDTVPKVMQRLCTLAGPEWYWYVDAGKKLWCGDSTLNVAPFSVSDDPDDWDYSTIWPVEAGSLSVKPDSSVLLTKVIIIGGQAAGAEVTDQFVGGDGIVQEDGSLLFNLSATNICDWVSVTATVDGTTTDYSTALGVDWYDTFDDYEVLGDKKAGTVRFDAGLVETATNVTVVYRPYTTISATATNDTLYAELGFHLATRIKEPAITSQDLADDYAQAILDIYAAPVINGTGSVPALGLHPGQYIQITSTLHGLAGYYSITKANISLKLDGRASTCDFSFGGYQARLSDAVGGGGGGGVAIPPGAPPLITGDVGILRVRDKIVIVRGNIAMGDSTGFMAGIGAWQGYDPADGKYKQYLGDPDGEHFSWDGENLEYTGIASGVIYGTVETTGTNANTWKVNENESGGESSIKWGSEGNEEAYARYNGGDNLLLNKGIDFDEPNMTIDGVDVSAHADRHGADQADPVITISLIEPAGIFPGYFWLYPDEAIPEMTIDGGTWP